MRRFRLLDTYGRVWFMGAAVVLNLGLLGVHGVLGFRLDRVGLVRTGTRLVPPSGITSDGRLVTDEDYRSRSCHVVRYESTRCAYCVLDHPHFEKLAREAAARSCSVTVVAPHPDQFFPDASPVAGVALAYPSVEAAGTLPWFGTPTTLVARADWTVAWAKTGALVDADLASALAGAGAPTTSR